MMNGSVFEVNAQLLFHLIEDVGWEDGALPERLR
jgi:hypothetical protein